MNRLWDILLLPSRLYEKLTDNKVTLVAGVLLIGFVDLFLPDVKAFYKLYFTGKPSVDIYYNIAIAVFLVILLGVIDTVFLSLPLFDISKYLKRKEGLPHQASLIKVIKAYILSHFIIIPVDIVAYFTVFRHVDKNSSITMQNLSAALFFLTLIWMSAIIARGINTLFSFGPLIRRLTFIIVFTWNCLFGVVFGMEIAGWLLKLLK